MIYAIIAIEIKKEVDTMKEKIIYICDYCRKEFESESKYYRHKRAEVSDKIKYFAADGKPLPYDASPDFIEYFWATDIEALDMVDNYFEKYGYGKPSDDTCYTKGYFYYDGENWKNVEELRKKLKYIEDIFQEVEDYED